MFTSFSTSTICLQIRLLGPFGVQINGAPMRRLRTSAGNWLLALLVLHWDRPVTRKELAERLWPASDASAARGNLRRALTDLRSALGAQAYRLSSPTTQTLALDLTDAEVDLLTFDALIGQTNAAAQEQAVALYRGPLLPECEDLLVLAARQAREAQMVAARARLAALALTAQRYAAAIDHAEAVLTVEPWRETVLRALMTAQAAQGEYERAMQTYRDFRIRLQHPDSTPEPATTATFLQIQAAARQQRQTRPATPAGAPPLTTIPRSLPEPPVSLWGRAEAIPEIVFSLDRARLITLVGCGGIGKTQLAIQVAHDALGHFAGGAWFIDLAALDDPAQILPGIATTLGVPERAGQLLEADVIDRLRPEPLLLVLDNCEHLLAACAPLAQRLLHECPPLRVLATSRQPLGLPCEQVWQVPALSVPPEACLSNLRQNEQLPAALREAAAVQLFVDRATRVRPRFALTLANAGAVVRICRRLEGIPLALELAAAWVRSLAVEEIARRLDDCFALLIRGDPDAHPRQQTLQAALDWSYHLLTEEDERRFLGAMSVFAGGWTLEAAEAVGIVVAERSRIVHLLAELVDKSLVVYEETNGIGRYRLLEPIRQYAQQKGAENGALPALRERHFAHFLEVATTAEPHLRGSDQARTLDLLDLDRDNLRAALKWSCDDRHAEQGLRLATAISLFWMVRCYFLEGQICLEQLLGCGEPPSDDIRLKALGAAGGLAFRRADYACAMQYYTEQLELAERLGNSKAVAAASGNLGNIASQLGQLPVARTYFDRSMRVFRELEDQHGIVLTLGNLAILACREKDYPSACTHNEEAISLWEQSGANVELAVALNNLADVRYTLGEFAVAESHLQRSMAISLRLENRRVLANSLAIAQCIAADQGRMERSAVLAGAEAALREHISIPAPEETVAECSRHLALAKAELGTDAFENAFQRGREMALSLQELGAFVLNTE